MHMSHPADDAARTARFGLDPTALRVGLALLGLHVALLLVPPVPPYWKGSLPSYILGYVAILLLFRAFATRREAATTRWASAGAARRQLLAAGALATVLAGAFALRALAPETFVRFSREEGLWEPLTLFCYLASALLLWPGAGSTGDRDRRPWVLASAFFLLLVLEEIDWFGIFGGVIGRVEGIYAGSLHDIIRLVAEGVMPPLAMTIIAAGTLVVLLLLLRSGYLAPRWIGDRLREPAFLWFVIGAGFLLAAAAEDALLFGGLAAEPSPEEALELAGALCLFVYAFELRHRRPEDGQASGHAPSRHRRVRTTL